MRSNIIENYKKTLRLSDEQRDIIVGSLLGDGCLETQNNGKTYRLKIENMLAQKDYVDWKYNFLKEWVLTPPQIKKHVFYGKERENYRFATVSHGSLRFYAQQFYQDGKKVMPKLIGKLLTPLALAVWFMDDGSIKSNHHKALVIHAQSFEKIDLEKAIKVLESKYSIKANLRKRDDGSGYVLYLLSETVDEFIDTVKGYTIPSMKYKLGNTIA